jgi:wyosine [tRNA(Phe)-imidazoG37] synthetase (radical SAM superfamily)
MRADHSGLIFGPVRSGRLGASLGLDLLGAKICSFDCLYCEAGHTRALTLSRKPYVPAGKLLGELAAWLCQPHPDFEVVTLGGMGEPTLNSDLGRIITGVRELLPEPPVAVLTNSSLMHDPAVRAELALADIVLPSLDTLVPSEFAAINKPIEGATLADIRRGLLEFRSLFAGKLYLEVLVLAGVNDTAENLERLAAFVGQLAPDRVDVVTMTRPGAYPQALPVPPATLERFRQAFGDGRALRGQGKVVGASGTPGQALGGDSPTQAEVPEKTAQFANSLDNAPLEGLHELSIRVLDSLARRPQTARGLAQALGAPETLLTNLLDDLASRGLLKPETLSGETFYVRGSRGRK